METAITATLIAAAICGPIIAAVYTWPAIRANFTRAGILGRLKAMYDAGDTTSAAFETLAQRLAHMDGIRHSGRVYYLTTIVGGEPSREGMAAAVHSGGIDAAREYGRVIDRAQ